MYYKNDDELLASESLQVFDVKSLPRLLALDDVNDCIEMTSLGNLILLGQNSSSKLVEDLDDDSQLQRLSLAYERLHCMPKILIQELSHKIKILDLSHNEFENLDFLEEFKGLTSLICDHNYITSTTKIPYLPKLELLWLNHCKITMLYPWAKYLQYSCPNLRYLSLMGNSAAPSYLNGGTFYEYLQYRLFIISLFPNLIHLDDKPVTLDQRKEADRLYHRPLIERFVTKTHSNLPNYLRNVSTIVSDLLVPSVPLTEKNFII